MSVVARIRRVLRAGGVFQRMALCACLAVSSPGFAQDEEADPELAIRLAEISRAVDAEGTQLAALDQKQKKLGAEQAELDKSMKALEATLRDTRAKLTQLAADREKLLTESQETGDRMQHVQKLALSRLRALYMQRKANVMERMLVSSGDTSFGRNVFFFRKIREFDQRLIAEMSALRVQQDQSRTALELLLKEQEGAHTRLKDQTQAMAEKVKRLDQVKKSIQTERKKREELVLSLRAQALRLESVVAGLTGGTERSQSKEETERQARQGRTGTSDRLSRALGDEVFAGAGLNPKTTVVPVEGAKILQRFGTEREGGFSGVTKSKGIEFSVSEESSVRAIEMGRVIFGGRMPNYGEILIIDHGEREYSLYGRLGGVGVKTNDRVEKGASIAVTSDEGDEPSFYFEIRKNGTPINPITFVPGLK